MDAEILAIKAKHPEWGRLRICNALREAGHTVSPATVQRRLAKLNATRQGSKPRTKIIEDLTSGFSTSELRAILAGAKQKINTTKIEWRKESFKVLVMSDTHIGHKKFYERLWWAMAELAVEQGVDWAYHAGDILEGMSGRPGHIYELSELGFEQQFRKAVDLISGFPMEIRAITGNHDLWYMGKADIGINPGARLAAELDNYVHLGDEEADEIIGRVRVKLWHGRDGSSYATSYRGQKFIEGLTGGNKPHVLLSGHAHKAIFQQCRGVQHLECGTICGQTGFMRHKKMAAHPGFWIVEIWQNENGLERIAPCWHPYWEE